jgi:hypothetical protein
MGQVYFDMGLLASKEVVECSASDLVGQYVGHVSLSLLRRFFLKKADHHLDWAKDKEGVRESSWPCSLH